MKLLVTMLIVTLHIRLRGITGSARCRKTRHFAGNSSNGWKKLAMNSITSGEAAAA